MYVWPISPFCEIFPVMPLIFFQQLQQVVSQIQQIHTSYAKIRVRLIGLMLHILQDFALFFLLE